MAPAGGEVRDSIMHTPLSRGQQQSLSQDLYSLAGHSIATDSRNERWTHERGMSMSMRCRTETDISEMRPHVQVEDPRHLGLTHKGKPACNATPQSENAKLICQVHHAGRECSARCMWITCKS